jgi:uncharacterized protein
MNFVVYCLDHHGMEERRSEHRDAHRAHLQNTSIRRLIAGPLTEPDGTTICGNFSVYEGDDIEALREYVLRDPYNEAGIWKTVEIRPFIMRIDNR